MLPFKKFIVIPIIIGILAALIQALDQFLAPMLQPEGNRGFSWIAFQSWAIYFLAGCNIKGGIKAFLAYFVGIGASILIMELGGILTPSIVFWAVPVSVGLVAFLVIFLERVDLFSLIPALFIGAGAFFAFMSYVPGATYTNAYITEMIYCTIGLLFGVVTVSLRTQYENSLKKGR